MTTHRFVLAVVMVFVLAAAFLILPRHDIPPVAAPDLSIARSELPAAENAYAYFAEAMEALYWPWGDEAFKSAYMRRETIAAEQLREIFARNEETIELIRQGLACGACQFPRWSRPEDLDLRALQWFDMARMLALQSRENQRAGKAAEAVDMCVTLLGFGSLLQRNAELFLAHAWGMTALQIGSTRAQELAGDAMVTGGDLERLAEALSRIGPFDDGLIRTIKGEYAYHCAVIDQTRSTALSIEGLDWSRYGAQMLGWRLLERSRYSFAPGATKRVIGELARQMIANTPRCYAEIERIDADALLGLGGRKSPRIWARNAIGIDFGLQFLQLENLFDMKSLDETNLAATRLIVALHRYRRDRGRFPDDLQALVPGYLDAVPRDPYDGRPFRYARDKGVVYAVGENLTDDGGDAEEGKKRRFHQRNDLVYPITKPETPAP